jgi:RNA polymerase sigma factor (sigma-70 family)
MVNGRANTALRQVARVFHEGTLTGLSDRQILERFVDRRDESAFEALMVRHGPMVLNVCRQLLRNPHDVEDAFQAVFLVLVRKARGVRVEGSLGPWLYTVANRVAARARANRRRLGTREISAAMEIAESTADRTLDRLEVAGVIQEELGRLPERLRAPIVLCYLQGMTHELAAGQLGCPVGTVRSRLSRARAQLLMRITRRGLTLSAAGLVSALDSIYDPDLLRRRHPWVATANRGRLDER